MLLTSAALLSRLTKIEESQSASYKNSSILWEDDQIEITGEMSIQGTQKATSLQMLFEFLKRENKNQNLTELWNKVGSELCSAMKMHATFSVSYTISVSTASSYITFQPGI